MGKKKPVEFNDLDEASKKWILKHEKLMEEGGDIVDAAVTEALDYLQDAIDNLNDRQWRKMTMSTQVVEMGIGVMLAERVVPVLYNEMAKNMHKKLKVTPETAQALRHIFIGRVIKNVRKALDERDTK